MDFHDHGGSCRLRSRPEAMILNGQWPTSCVHTRFPDFCAQGLHIPSTRLAFSACGLWLRDHVWLAAQPQGAPEL